MNTRTRHFLALKFTDLSSDHKQQVPQTAPLKKTPKTSEQNSQSYQRSVRKQFKIEKRLFPCSQLSGSSSESEVMFTFPSWRSTPRSPPNVSTKRDLMKWKLIELSLFHGDAVSSTRFFRRTSRFLFCLESAGWTTGHSWGILVVYFGFQGPKPQRSLHKWQTQGKDPKTTPRESGLHFQMEFLQVCTHTKV